MWQVKNKTPFATAGTFERDQNGREVWVIALRASFTVAADGQVRMAEAQTPVRMVPDYAGRRFRSAGGRR